MINECFLNKKKKNTRFISIAEKYEMWCTIPSVTNATRFHKV